MRYACLKHAAESPCSGDQAKWCVWMLEEGAGSKGHCELHFGDSDFIHFLMWSGIELACVGSKVSEIVQCSFGVSPEVCSELQRATCKWTEGACYPVWYGSIITKPKPLAAFKQQVRAAPGEGCSRPGPSQPP